MDVLFNIFFLSDWLVNKSQLVPLGITDQHLQFSIGVLGAIGCFYLLHPIIKLLVVLQWSKLLTYIIGSIIFLNILVFLNVSYDMNYLASNVEQIGDVALGITFFGIVLFVFQLVLSIFHYFKQQKSKSF